MPPSTLTFPNGDRYHSARIELSLSSDGTWAFGLPVDAEMTGSQEADGKFTLRLGDGRVGECRWVGHDEGFLRFVGIGALERREVVEAVSGEVAALD